MQSFLKVSVCAHGGTTVVQVDGELDLASSRQLEFALEDAWASAPDEIVLDLADLRFMDMAGLRLLVRATQRAAERGADLVLTNVSGSIRRVLALTGVNGLLAIRR